MPNYRDSQADDSATMNTQEDIFEERPSAAGCADLCRQNNKLLVENNKLLKENSVMLKELLKEMEKLKKANAPAAAAFSVEQSAIERPLTEYLKIRFGKNPYLLDPDVELRHKITTLKRKHADDFDTNEVIRVSIKFCHRKLVDYRAQTKKQLIGKQNKVDLGEKSLYVLAKTLFARFTGEEIKEETINLAIALRAFCHENKVLKKQNGDELDDFWGMFKNFLQDILDDQEDDKWLQMKEREENRIERYKRLVPVR